jgi:hypothetical protein
MSMSVKVKYLEELVGSDHVQKASTMDIKDLAIEVMEKSELGQELMLTESLFHNTLWMDGVYDVLAVVCYNESQKDSGKRLEFNSVDLSGRFKEKYKEALAKKNTIATRWQLVYSDKTENTSLVVMDRTIAAIFK